jgi:general secretion pathway protein E
MVEPAFNQMQVPTPLIWIFRRTCALMRQDGHHHDWRDPRSETASGNSGGAHRHLVLSTLHTNDAPAAAERECLMGVPPYLISATLLGGGAASDCVLCRIARNRACKSRG